MTTSPRTPLKMIPEIDLLSTYFSGQPWNKATQTAFMELLREKEFFYGAGINAPDFSARDRINRAPQTLGFVTLKPTINLTPAGKELIASIRKEEILLHQLLKFQLPSPYHSPSIDAAEFWVKPYLEAFRLIRHFGTLKFDEMMIFGLQLVDYRKFEQVAQKIELFRAQKTKNNENYKKFRVSYLYSELKNIYSDEIAKGKIQTRENRSKTIDTFLKTKSRNMRDYADACLRYLRATGLVNISHQGKSMSIIPEKLPEVDYFLQTINPEPCYVDNLTEYVAYLGNPKYPELLTDNRDYITSKINQEFPDQKVDNNAPLSSLKNILYNGIEDKKNAILAEQVSAMKEYKVYDDISNIFHTIKQKDSLYDAPLILEWNTWRAITMMDGGNIKANLKFDDFGYPMSTAQGNMADIICDYGDFGLTVEVTMQVGHRQFEAEGESVARHLAKLKKDTNKPAYCLFIAPKINESCIAYFYSLHTTNISYYGGNSIIIPLQLDVFEKMIESSYKASYIPKPRQIQQLFEKSKEIATNSQDETTWHRAISEYAINWLQN